jgi:hypothetical protein
LIEDVGLEVTLGDEANNGSSLSIDVEGKGAFDVFAAEKGVSIVAYVLDMLELIV